jgi:valyl-tRNA synthetase
VEFTDAVRDIRVVLDDAGGVGGAEAFAAGEGARSIHLAAWPQFEEALIDEAAERAGTALLALTASIRRWKSTRKLGLGAELASLTIVSEDANLRAALHEMETDLRSVSRARAVAFAKEAGAGFEEAAPGLWLRVEA